MASEHQVVWFSCAIYKPVFVGVVMLNVFLIWVTLVGRQLWH